MDTLIKYFKETPDIHINYDVRNQINRLNDKLGKLREICDDDETKELFNVTLFKLRDICIIELIRLGYDINDKSNYGKFVIEDNRKEFSQFYTEGYKQLTITYFARLYWDAMNDDGTHKYPLKWTEYSIGNMISIPFMFQILGLEPQFEVGLNSN